ncbi:MAG: TraR/DksA family transcriptional regulator [Actinomycetota bacterium]|nr:TraR/DksA family transcriptional regulator [Actinomycetota bacterium]
MEQAQLDGLRVRLEEERSAVEAQLHEYEGPEGGERVDAALAEGFSDAAAATAERSEAVGHLDQLQTQRDAVEAALIRIAEGSYGKCERCGGEIPIERLDALPTASLCVTCKQASA